MIKFPSVRLYHLSGFSSDHKPIWLCSDDVHIASTTFRSLFVLRLWLKDERCEGVVHSSWDMCSADDLMGKVLEKDSNCQT